MLYCLSQDLYDDLVAMKYHDHCKYDETNSCLMVDIVPKECRMVSALSLICLAASNLRSKMDSWQSATLMARMWVTSVHPFTPDVVDLEFKHHTYDNGYWQYCYASLGAKKLYISKDMYSHAITVRGGVPKYCIDDGLSVQEHTLTEIANSNQYFKLAAVFPAEPRMFADDTVEYMIPYNLI